MGVDREQSGPGGEKGVFLSEVKKRRERRERYEREGDPSFWSVVSTTGTVGWTIALPTTAGALFGRWLDGQLDAGHVFMVFCMLVGLAAGCFVAWRMVKEKL